MKRRLARWLLHLLGWTLHGERPQHARYVLIAAPHTSNWDFPMMMLYAAAFDIQINWLAKHSLFRGPMGWFMRALGGVPVVRHRSNSLVDTLCQVFAEREALVLVVPAEGTRARAEFWKSGFYHIARRAQVPIVPSFLDYGRKQGGFGPALAMSESVVADMDVLREFYADRQGRYPAQFGPVRLPEEANCPPSTD